MMPEIGPFFPPASQPVPSVINEGQGIGATRPAGVFSDGGDTAKYIIQLRRFERPRFWMPGGVEFVWPLGVEGLRLTGSNKLGVHTYIGEKDASVQVLHRDEARFEMSGMFLGETASDNVRILRDALASVYPDDGAFLDLPPFQNSQKVYAETWDFTRENEARDDSWAYTVTFVRVGYGASVANPSTTKPPVNPVTSAANRGTSPHKFKVRDGARTLRAISNILYNTTELWREIYNENVKALNKLGIPLLKLPTAPLPLGMTLTYADMTGGGGGRSNLTV